MNEQNFSQPNEPIQNSKHIWITIIAVALTAIIVGGGIYAWQKSSSQATEQSLQQKITDLQNQITALQESTQPIVTIPETTEKQTQPVNELTNWKKYRNEIYGFEFNYPPNSTVETRDDSNYQYIRLQNYSATDDRIRLAAGEYYLEIFIFDHQKGHESWESCTQQVVDAKEVELGFIMGYRGYGQEGGDAGGIKFALCSESPDVDYYIQGTENDQNAPLVNPILDSFKFTK
ncbi:MAG: hypothetical protein ABIC82_02880 [bacterium]